MSAIWLAFSLCEIEWCFWGNCDDLLTIFTWFQHTVSLLSEKKFNIELDNGTIINGTIIRANADYSVVHC